MLIALWSAKGGSGTSVFTAACAVVLARDARAVACGVRVADLAGDLPAIFGLGAEPALGRRSTGSPPGPKRPPTRSTGSWSRSPPGSRCLPRGGAGAPGRRRPVGEAGAALAVALREARSPTLVDCGTRVGSGEPRGGRGRRRLRRRAPRLLSRPPARGARLRARVDHRGRAARGARPLAVGERRQRGLRPAGAGPGAGEARRSPGPSTPGCWRPDSPSRSPARPTTCSVASIPVRGRNGAAA